MTRQAMARLAMFTRRASQLLMAVSAAGLVAMTAIIGWQVFGRYVLNASPSWSEQAALVLMIWYVTLAAAAGVRQGFHIRIAALENAVPPRAARVMRLASHACVAFAGVAMAIWGGALVTRTWSHVMPALGLSRGVAYLGLPFAGALIVLFALERLWREWGGMSDSDDDGEYGSWR